MNKEAAVKLSGLALWEKLKKDAETIGSDFFDYVSDETLNIISDRCEWLEDDFKGYLECEKDLKNQVKAICPDTFNEKWKTFLKVYIQAEEQTSTRTVNIEAIMQLLPFVSDMAFTYDGLEIKIDVFNPKLIYLFGNVGADEYTEEDGWYRAW